MPESHRPIVIAHRGASGYRPEHTIESYRLAIELGADYIEPDLVMTSDGVLIARHDAELSATTDIADRAEFADRRCTKSLDGTEMTGWFAEDFTYAEVQTLRAVERIPQVRPGNREYDGKLSILIFDDIIELTLESSRNYGRKIGIYPEIKHPTHLKNQGHKPADALLEVIEKYDLAGGEQVPFFLQCFEPTTLRYLAERTSLPLVQLIDDKGRPFDWESHGDERLYTDMVTVEGLREVATYAQTIGVHKSLLFPRDANDQIGAPSSVIADAHEVGLKVHAWTFRNENTFLPANMRKGASPGDHGDAAAEYAAFFAAGLDGVFSDFPDSAVAARTQ